jgi:hypothetical protein
MDLNAHFLDVTRNMFHGSRSRADRAIAQIEDRQLHEATHDGANSIAVIMKHLAGNMRSRWTEFLTTDGEKPWRHRDGEFVDDFESRAQLDEVWEAGWRCLFEALDGLRPEDLGRTVTIRGEAHTVMQAILRQIGHYDHHVGQIVQRARDLAGDGWQTLSIPRGRSEDHNRDVGQT